MRCGTPGTSWHVTTKSSFCDWGVLYKSGVCPWEICKVSGESRTERGEIPSDRLVEVSRGHSRGASLEGPNGMRGDVAS